MKKWFILLLCFVMLISAGCDDNTLDITENPTTEATNEPTLPPETTTPTVPPTTVPEETEPPVPETVTGTVLADYTVLLSITVPKDTEVEVVGEFDENHYILKTELGYGLISKKLVRLEGAEAYEQWNGYAKSNAKFYDNYHLIPGNEVKQKKNTKVQVLEDLGESLLVQIGDTVGYMRASDVSEKKIQSATGGGGGGSDGGDISLDFQGDVSLLSTVVVQEGEITGKGTVLADNAEIFYGWFDRDEQIQIITEAGYMEEKEGWYPVWLDGLCGYARQNLVLLDGEEPYAPWEGYAKKNAPIYDNYFLSGKQAKKLAVNTKVNVICDLETCYLAQVGEDYCYIAKDKVSETKIKTGGGGGGGGGDWTPPAM